MTKSEFLQVVRKEYPVYQKYDDAELMTRIQNALLQPGAHRIMQFLAQHQISTGLLAGWFQKRLTKQQAETLEAAMKAAQSLNAMDIAVLSSQMGVPVGKLGDYRIKELRYGHEKEMAGNQHQSVVQLKELDHRNAKDLETHKASLQKDVIDHDVMKKAELADRLAQAHLIDAAALQNRIDVVIDEIEELQKQPQSPGRDLKIETRQTALDAMRRELNERFGG